MPQVRVLALLGSLLAAAAPAVGQTQAAPRSADYPCFHPRPKPACGAFFLTNAGVYVKGGDGGIQGKAIVDWGAMVNTSPRNSFGASWFVTLEEEDDFSTGPVARYRHWFGEGRSLDVAVGTPVAADQIKPGSILGSVKYSPVQWFGVALRPEAVRRTTYECVDVACTAYANHTATSARVYAGVEFGWVPGVVLTAGAGLFLVLALAAYSGSD